MIDPDNSRSVRVARRLNFVSLRNDVLVDTDVVVYALHPRRLVPRQHRR